MSPLLDLSIVLAKALGATLVVEECAALCWRERSKRLALVVFLANVATNPAINVALTLAPDALYDSPTRYYTAVAALELTVLAVETAIFKRWGPFAAWSRALLFATSLNGASYFSGWILEPLGYWDW